MPSKGSFKTPAMKASPSKAPPSEIPRLFGKSISHTDIIAFGDHLEELKLHSGGRRDKFRDNLEAGIKTILVSYIAFFIASFRQKLTFNLSG